MTNKNEPSQIKKQIARLDAARIRQAMEPMLPAESLQLDQEVKGLKAEIITMIKGV